MRYGKYIRIEVEGSHLSQQQFIKKIEMDQEMEKLLWDYIDGRCSPEEIVLINKHLAEEASWQSSYAELMNVNKLLKDEELDMPSLRFTKNVMEEIAKYQVAPATKNYINKNIIRGIGLFFGTMILGLLIYVVGQIQWRTNPSGHFNIPIDTEKINPGKFLNSTYVNVFIGITIILALILLDQYMHIRKNSTKPGHWTNNGRS